MSLIKTDAKTIFKLATPMLFSLILEQIIGLTDIIFLGRVSEVSVGPPRSAESVFICSP